MILTQCAACAAPLDNKWFRCGICKTRYCGHDCQKLHWKKGGHKALCQQIKSGGGAEQYHADKKYKEAVAVAVKKCAADTKGQTCYICTEALHWKTKEGLVRGCSCRGTAGFAHVSCLAEQAKILVAEAEDNNLDSKTKTAKYMRWVSCGLCEQRYHGVVACALGWACWKTYVGRPEKDQVRRAAMSQLGNGLYAVKHYEETLSVQEAELSMRRRLGESEETILATQSNLAAVYGRHGRPEPALRLRRECYLGFSRLHGEESEQSLTGALNYSLSLTDLRRYQEAKSLLREKVPVARRVLGENHNVTLNLRWYYAGALYQDPAATLDDIREALTMLEETEPIARRVLGGANPVVVGIEHDLRVYRARLRGAPPSRA